METDQFIEYMQQVDFPTLIVMGLMLWFFKSRMYIKLDKMDVKIDTLRDDVQDIDRRLRRLERAFFIRKCCMIKDHRLQEKIE